MVSGNRVRSEEDGELHPSAGDNGGGEGGLSPVDQVSWQEIEEMRRRLLELEELTHETLSAAAASHDSTAAVTTSEKAEVDACSIYVGNVDYACLPEEVQQHFQDCGTVNGVTILIDDFGQPNGFAYMEFLEVEAVQNALLLNEIELHGRPLKVCPKRTNVPGMNRLSGRRPFHPSYPSYRTYGKVPRSRRPPGFWPYY